MQSKILRHAGAVVKGKDRTIKVIFEQIVSGIIRTTNAEVTFISWAILVLLKWSANYE